MQKQTHTQLLILSLIISIQFAAISFLLPLLPNLQERFLIQKMTLGWLEATFAITHLLALPLFGRLADRFGTRRILRLSLIGQTFAFLLLALSPSTTILFIARAIGGGSSAILPIAVRWVKHHLDETTQLSGITYVMLGVTVGASLGPLLSGFLGSVSMTLPSLIALSGGFIGIFLVRFLPNETEHTRTNKPTALSPNLLTLGVVFLFVSTSFHLYRILIPFYVEEVLTKPPLYSGLMLGGLSLGAAITQMVLVKSSPTLKLVNAYFMSTAIITLALFLVITDGMTGVVISLVILSIGIGLADPLGGALLGKLSTEETMGESSGTVFAIGALGKILGPVLGGIILTKLPFSYGFILASLIALCGVILIKKIR